eukprot:CAMPEP_0177524664 /NCGR_PEP_ID=MMETSP0369-20130122/50096_1 /TAXON_ID=447022 ORGANISM="Scrippsiella hangoei-like, Strain SHHI-4" /NCGR_SAMPLE_ID=MMETSP0369 /ASSEMBLY_ACC=CAM_ASM_000364 /LENGTH=198 /DNA_ID=CAMNT_0019004687 /DNA_START=6 /DNA_END=599 /DNA_ORIENTATION=+
MALRKGAVVACSGLALLGASTAFTRGRPGANGRLPAEREAAAVKDRLRGLSAEQLRADAPKDSEGFVPKALALGLALGLAAGVLGAPAARAASTDMKALELEATSLATKIPNMESKKTLQASKAEDFIENEANKGTALRTDGIRTADGQSQGNVIKNSIKAKAPTSSEFFGNLPSVDLPVPALPALEINEGVSGLALG